MSRDWTPLEHYLSEQSQIKRGYGDIFNFMESLKMVYSDGTKVVLHSPEEMAIRRQFPTLGRLFMDGFMELYERLSKDPRGLDFLHKKDAELEAYLKAREFQITEDSPERVVVNAKSWEGNKDSYLIQWFEGRLDENFYYSERNNELFIECMLSDAMALNREAYDKVRFEAALERHSLDVDIEENRDFFETHANKLVYISENKKDLLDFDFWVRYELLLGEKITWDEYIAIDNKFDGDPHDIEFSNKRIINKFKTALKHYRESNERKASLDENIKSAQSNTCQESKLDMKCNNKALERD